VITLMARKAMRMRPRMVPNRETAPAILQRSQSCLMAGRHAIAGSDISAGFLLTRMSK
jgi:hypothetical protein